jgi:bacterioferritin (cytochrome b1)
MARTTKTATDIGTNRTGIAASPLDAPDVISAAEKLTAKIRPKPGDPSALAAERSRAAREAEPIGTVPPPASLKGVVKTAAQALKGEKATVLLDKLGERLAFERAGVRLYELALTKSEVYPSWEGGPRGAALAEIRDDELEHFGLVEDYIQQLGGDPTAMTPSADLVANLSKGVRAVLADPRTDLRQCVEGLLVAELSDNAGWETLIALARDAGQTKMVTAFERALETEQEHLARVQGWARLAGQADAHFDLPAPGDRPPART